MEENLKNMMQLEEELKAFSADDRNVSSHAKFAFDFRTTGVDSRDVLLKLLNNNEKGEFFYAFEDLKIIDTNELLISRVKMYESLFNDSSDAPTEQVRINLNKGGQNYLYISKLDDLLKKEVTFLSKEGEFFRNVKFKKFTNIDEIMFLNSIFIIYPFGLLGLLGVVDLVPNQ